ncbi:MAG: histidine triad nucleotide-binding protein [Eubacteriales bacterium]|nr:histidine triad nucleotide-binding protein [Eubacteriales bacterium]
MSQDCIFCKIISGEIPSKKIFENDHVLAFEDSNPVAPVHALIVPKKHYTDILEISSSEEGRADLCHLMAALTQISEELGVDERGFRLINNCGEEGGQTVLHVHFHLIGGKKLGAGLI